jgi:hypothetical protein
MSRSNKNLQPKAANFSAESRSGVFRTVDFFIAHYDEIMLQAGLCGKSVVVVRPVSLVD